MRLKDKLRVYYSEKEQDIVLCHPMGFQTKCDGGYLSTLFNGEMIQELERRGYDVTTLRFSIEPKSGHKRFAATRYPDNGCQHGDHEGDYFDKDGEQWIRCSGCGAERCLK